MYSLCILLFLLPLYFSHIFLPFGAGGFSIDGVFGFFEPIISHNSSFERQKIYLFYIFLCIACIEGIIRYPYSIWDTLRKYYHIICVLVLLPIYSGYYFQEGLDTNFLVGSFEKHHGYFFYIGVITFTLLIMSGPKEHLRKYLIWSIYSAILVAVIAIGEYIGGIWDIYNRSQMMSMYPGRSLSTLGNPNYLAGFLLPFVPIFIFYIKNNYKKIVFPLIGSICLLIGIFATGSYIAIFITCIIFLWYGIELDLTRVSMKKKLSIFVLIIVSIILFGFFLLNSEKLLSFQSRFILMKESISMMIDTPLSVIIGFGPESLLRHFSGDRTILINQYFPKSMLIDSSHNIIIDIFFQYGVFLLALITMILYRNRSKFTSPIFISIISLIFFLSLNVFIISHLLFLILLIIILIRYPNIISDKVRK